MNELDKHIQHIRKQRFIYLSLVGSGLLLGLVIYAFWLFLSKSYSVMIMPEEARSTSRISVNKGWSLSIGSVLYTLSQQTTITVQAKDFLPEQLTVDSTQPAQEKTVNVTLRPLPAIIQATTSPSLANVEWFIDGELVHIGSILEHRMPPGDIELRIEHPFFQPLQDNIRLQRNQRFNNTWLLKRVTGDIDIDTSPVKGEVFINDVSVGKAPIRLQRPADNYTMTIVAEGYEHINETTAITYANTMIKRRYQLAPTKGELSLTLSPVEGDLLIDDIAINIPANQSTTAKEEIKVAIEANKNHRIYYSKPGYFSYTHSLSVKPKESKSLNIKLQKEFGQVDVNVSPAATVIINGKPLPSLQSSLSMRLQASKQAIEFTLPGYRSQTHYVTPSSQLTKTVTVNLLTEFEARRKEGRPLYASTLGIQLQAVKPSLFMMGSPANEVGRKRNEFQLAVDFSRAIWVSRHEITQEQYAAYDGKSPHTRLPVSNVTWADAAKYTNWLSEKEGLPVFYQVQGGRVVGFDKQSTGYRLLTEAEWEWLAKQGKRASATQYVWGNSDRIPNNTGNFADKTLASNATFYFPTYDDGFADKSPVGSFKADRLGLFDLAGNVSEWVHDQYTNSPPNLSGIKTDYMGASRGIGHVFKGGNYTSGRLSELRGAFRGVSQSAAPTIGFRIARFQ